MPYRLETKAGHSIGAGFVYKSLAQIKKMAKRRKYFDAVCISKVKKSGRGYVHQKRVVCYKGSR